MTLPVSVRSSAPGSGIHPLFAAFAVKCSSWPSEPTTATAVSDTFRMWEKSVSRTSAAVPETHSLPKMAAWPSCLAPLSGVREEAVRDTDSPNAEASVADRV